MLAKGEHPQHIVCMNSEVEFRDDTTSKVQKVTLVYPEEADISQRKISVPDAGRDRINSGLETVNLLLG